MPRYRRMNQIVRWEATRGTETSKYPEEKKETSIPQVAASERGRAQTTVYCGVVDRSERAACIAEDAWNGVPQGVKVP